MYQKLLFIKKYLVFIFENIQVLAFEYGVKKYLDQTTILDCRWIMKKSIHDSAWHIVILSHGITIECIIDPIVILHRLNFCCKIISHYQKQLDNILVLS